MEKYETQAGEVLRQTMNLRWFKHSPIEQPELQQQWVGDAGGSEWRPIETQHYPPLGV